MTETTARTGEATGRARVTWVETSEKLGNSSQILEPSIQVTPTCAYAAEQCPTVHRYGHA